MLLHGDYGGVIVWFFVVVLLIIVAVSMVVLKAFETFAGPRKGNRR